MKKIIMFLISIQFLFNNQLFGQQRDPRQKCRQVPGGRGCWITRNEYTNRLTGEPLENYCLNGIFVKDQYSCQCPNGKRLDTRGTTHICE